MREARRPDKVTKVRSGNNPAAPKPRKSAVTELGNPMERFKEAKLLVRRASGEDRRLRTLHLTPSGRKLLQEVNTKVDQQELRMKQAVGDAFPEVVAGLGRLMRAYGL